MIARFLTLFSLLLVAAPVRALDEDLYARLLERHTVAVEDIASTRVDYHALRGSEAWESLIRSLAASSPEDLESREERLAFWINAGVLPFVVAHLPAEEARWIREHDDALRVRHLDYDWSLNDTRDGGRR